MIKLTVDISDIKGTWYVTKSTSQNWNGIVLVLSDRQSCSWTQRDGDYYSSVYELTPEKINKIDSLGIKKIRISNGTSYRDKTFEYNSLGKFLGKCYKNILKRLESPLKKKGLFDDF